MSHTKDSVDMLRNQQHLVVLQLYIFLLLLDRQRIFDYILYLYYFDHNFFYKIDLFHIQIFFLWIEC